MNAKTTRRFRIENNNTRKGETTQANRNLHWEKHHLPTLGILLVEPGRKRTLNWSKKKRLLAKHTLYSSSSLTWKRPRGNRQFSHPVHTFSLVEKSHVTIKRKIRMCWTHGFPWELVETKWLTNASLSQFWPCSYIHGDVHNQD